MNTAFVEVTQGSEFNWGKFMVAEMSKKEWQRRSEIGKGWLLTQCGWTYQHILVLDLQTGEGAMFRPGGSAKADLDKHRIWVCPMFEPFLTWLYQNWDSKISSLPAKLVLSDQEAPSAVMGYRRAGP